MTISWPSVKSVVHAVDAFSTRRRWSRRTNCWCALRISPPGSRCASTSIWKPLQMPRIGMPFGRGILHLRHDRRERGDRARTQVVAVAEAAGQHERVDAVEVVRAVPERDRLGAGDADRALRVAVVERTGEGDDPDRGADVTPRPRCRRRPRSPSSRGCRRRSRGALASTSSPTSPSTVSSKRLPMRTEVKSSTPSREKAPETAFPCGSSSSALGMTSTTMVGMRELRMSRAGVSVQSTAAAAATVRGPAVEPDARQLRSL